MKIIKMLNVKENKEVRIIIGVDSVEVKDLFDELLLFKSFTIGDNVIVNDIVKDIINNHFEHGYRITSMDLCAVESI